MRKVSRAGIAIPAELSNNICTDHLNEVISVPSTKISGDIYRGKIVHADRSVEYTVRDALKTLYKNKCGYCEKQANAPYIDHHRPTGTITGNAKNSRGYYWLCYEWTNLIPSCHDCNSVTAKGSKFPLSGARKSTHPTHGQPPSLNLAHFKYDSQYNLDERPLLLHPEYCDSQDHFKFDRDGKIIGITKEGKQTVSILKLDNEDLNGWRRKIYEDHLADVRKIIRKFYRPVNPISDDQFEELIGEWVEKLVSDANNPAVEYTFFRKYLLENIDYFFLEMIDPVFRKKVTETISDALLICAT